MDSLLATYASSDEEEDNNQQQQEEKPSNHPQNHPHHKLPPPDSPSLSNSSVFFSLPPPKSLFNSLPSPKSNLPPAPPPLQTLNSPPSSSIPKPQSQQKSSSLFSVLPQPKTQNLDPNIPSNPKRVVQFRPPVNPSTIKSRITDHDDDDDDDDDEKEKQRKRSKALESMNNTPSVKSFLSNIPAPRNSTTLGALPSSSGTGRRSILESDGPASFSNNDNNSKPSVTLEVDKSVVDASNQNLVSENYVNYDVYGGYAATTSNLGSASEDYANYNTYAASDSSNMGSATVDYANYNAFGGHAEGFNGSSNLGSVENYTNYDVSYSENSSNYEQYENKWVDRSMTTTEEIVARGYGKRGRNDIPQEIVEVKQDELMKNRPREDQTKLTGIAFGPSYQPVSAKGKPSKLHKRKHQIGTLYFDMKQRQMELAERRAKGFLTKAETQAKYGW